jgi:hypothetical protein
MPCDSNGPLKTSAYGYLQPYKATPATLTARSNDNDATTTTTTTRLGDIERGSRRPWNWYGTHHDTPRMMPPSHLVIFLYFYLVFLCFLDNGHILFYIYNFPSDYRQKPWLQVRPSQAKAKPRLLALAWPSSRESQSRLRPSQSQWLSGQAGPEHHYPSVVSHSSNTSGTGIDVCLRTKFMLSTSCRLTLRPSFATFPSFKSNMFLPPEVWRIWPSGAGRMSIVKRWARGKNLL